MYLYLRRLNTRVNWKEGGRRYEKRCCIPCRLQRQRQNAAAAFSPSAVRPVDNSECRRRRPTNGRTRNGFARSLSATNEAFEIVVVATGTDLEEEEIPAISAIAMLAFLMPPSPSILDRPTPCGCGDFSPVASSSLCRNLVKNCSVLWRFIALIYLHEQGEYVGYNTEMERN